MNQSTDFPKLLEELLKLAVEEGHEMLKAHQERIKFYSSLITAILGATIAGAMRARQPTHYLLLLAGPFLVIVLAVIAFKGTSRLYRRFLEAMVQKAKIEHALHLDDPAITEDQKFWQGETLLVTRHLETRKAFPSSQEFVDRQLNRGYQRPTILLFAAFIAAGLFVGVILANQFRSERLILPPRVGPTPTPSATNG